MRGRISVHIAGTGSVAEMGLVVLVGAACAVLVALPVVRVCVVGADGSADLGDVGSDGVGCCATCHAFEVVSESAIWAHCDAETRCRV